MRCPIYDRACGTAYQAKKCRCATCRTWNAEHSRKGRKPGNRTFHWSKETLDYTRRRTDRQQGIIQPEVPAKIIQDEWKPSARMLALWAEADAAFRGDDPGYIIKIAMAVGRKTQPDS